MRSRGALLTIVAVLGCASVMPAYAAPPTATPSPGYEARLQEQRAASSRNYQPVTKPVSPRRAKRTRAN